MVGKGGGEAASYNIPQDLYGEILCRLPSNDLLKLKVVCKDWLRLISSKGFIQKHLQRSKSDCNHLRILIQFYSTAEIIDCANNTSKRIQSCTYLLGCCDGLLLYYDSCLSTLVALNPCTGESILVVRITNQSHLHITLHRSLSLKFSWFGHHPVTADQYVLLLAYCDSGSITFELYSLSPDRNIDSLPLISSSTLADLRGIKHSYVIKCKKMGTLLHGRLHFLAIASESGGYGLEFVILVYDFETNKIMEMAYPAAIKRPFRMLGVVDGCLCAIKDDQVWMMKEYGVEESWTKYSKLDESPMAFCPNGDVIFLSDGFRKVISKYSKREREAKIISKFSFLIPHDCIATVCIDSLVSPTLLLLGRDEE